MNAFAFDTLRFSKRLQEAGVDQAQAEAMSEALSEAVGDSVATKSDLESSVGVLRLEAKSDLDSAVSAIRLEIRESQVTMLKWLVPLLLGQTAVLAALMRVL